MYDISYFRGVKGYRYEDIRDKHIKNINIPNGITRIKERALYGCSMLHL